MAKDTKDNGTRDMLEDGPELFDLPFPNRNSIDAKLFHSQNPSVFMEYERIVLEGVRNGRTLIGTNMVWEVMRWFLPIKTVGNRANPADPSRSLKLNNNFAPYYARAFVKKHPRFKALFKFRATNVDKGGE